MSVREVTYYQAVCDGCQKVADYHEFHEFTAWSDEAGALESAFEMDWVNVSDRLHCPQCQNCPDCGYLRHDEDDELVCEECADNEPPRQIIEVTIPREATP